MSKFGDFINYSTDIIQLQVMKGLYGQIVRLNVYLAKAVRPDAPISRGEAVMVIDRLANES